MNPLNWAEATATVDAAASILLVTHVSPDGDAIGSMLGLANVLIARGKQPDMVVDGGTPDFLRFLPGTAAIRSAAPDKQWDVLITLDSSDEERTGLAGAFGRAHSKTVINLDHHATNTRFGQIHLIDGAAVSATEIVARWIKALGQSLTPEIALPLLTGLVTDTMGFRTSNVRPDTLDLARDLMAAGASLTEIMARTLNSKSYRDLLLWRAAMGRVELADGVITSMVTVDDLRALDFHDATDADFVSLLIQVEEAQVAVVFKQTFDHRVKLTMRSKPGYDTAVVALSVGGGGHKQAAGATVVGTLDEVKARIMPLLHQAVEKGQT